MKGNKSEEYEINVDLAEVKTWIGEFSELVNAIKPAKPYQIEVLMLFRALQLSKAQRSLDETLDMVREIWAKLDK